MDKIEGSYIFIVADGMGGHLAGEVASKMAVDCIIDFIKSNSKLLKEGVRLINEAMVYANKKKKPRILVKRYGYNL